MRKIRTAFVIFAGLALWSTSTFAQDSPPDSKKAKEIVALVEKAAVLLSAKGMAVLPEFRKKDTEWRTGDTYLFGNYMTGIQYLNAGFPEREGKDQSGTKDSNGKDILMEFQKTVKSKSGAGWANYMWPKPGQTQPSQKWSYLKSVKVDGKRALIGAGFYPN